MTSPGHEARAEAPDPSGAGSIAEAWAYLPGFLSRREATDLLDWLLESMAWQTETVRLFGQIHTVPRLVAWCGDAGLTYRYAGCDHRAEGWPAPLDDLRARLARETGVPFNFLLLNRYRCGADGMGWHRDDEPMDARCIASLSVGAERRFLIRPSTGGASVRLDLAHGSLLLMDRHLPHALPKTRRTLGERVNLSFRRLPCST